MRKIPRAMLVQAVTYKANQFTDKDWEPGLIHSDLYRAFKQTTSIGERRYPPLGKEISEGQFVLFVNKYSRLATGAVLFTICAYRHGHVPESFSPDFSRGEVDVKPIDIVDADGNKGELVHTYRCLAYGQILMVELVSGAGGVASLQKLLSAILRVHSGIGRKHPLLKLKDIIAPDLRALIDAHGGVTSMRANAMRAADYPSGRFGKLLSKAVGSVYGANKCVIEWTSESGETLDTDAAISVMDEVANEYVTGVSLKFRSGGGISDLSEYVEKRIAQIPIQHDGRPSITAIEYALKQYMAELCDGASPTIKTDGTLRDSQVVERT